MTDKERFSNMSRQQLIDRIIQLEDENEELEKAVDTATGLWQKEAKRGRKTN